MREPIHLLSLPEELLCEIAKRTDSTGLLALTLTCKLLNVVTKNRSLWLCLIADIEADTCVPRTLERATWDYTLQELQEWVLRRLRVRERLNCDVKTLTVRTPLKFLRDRRVQPAQLLPGGRWMISLNATCTQVYAYDLESYSQKLPYRHTLFDAGKIDKEEGTLDILSNFAIWLDPSQSGGISFRLLLWRISQPEEYHHVTRTCIYRVDSFHNAGTWSLEAKCLTIIRSREQVEKPAMAISDKYLVELRRLDPEKLQLVLYDYSDSNGNECNQKVIGAIAMLVDASYDPFEAHITPQNQIITLSRELINIYGIPKTQSDSPDRNITPLHRIHLCLDITYFSGPFSFAGIAWIIVAHKNKLTLTKLPTDSSSPVTQSIGEVEFISREYMTRVGPRASVFLRHDWSLDVITYSWDAVTMEGTFRIKRVEGVGSELDNGPARSWFVWNFDLSLGRIILFHASTDSCMIVDIY